MRGSSSSKGGRYPNLVLGLSLVALAYGSGLLVPSLLAFGLMFAFKQSMVILVPLIWMLWPTLKLRTYLWAAVVPVVTSLPFVLWAWPEGVKAMYADLVTFHARTPFRPEALTLSALCFRVTGQAFPSVLSAVGLAGFGVGFLVLVRRIPATPLFRQDRFLAFLLTFGFVFLTTLLFSKHAFTNYFYLFHFVLVLALAWSRIEDVRAATAIHMTDCVRCGSTESRRVLCCRGFDHAAERFDLSECCGCRLVSLSPLLEQDELAPYYNDAYYGGGASGKFNPVMEAGVRSANRARAAKLVAEWKPDAVLHRARPRRGAIRRWPRAGRRLRPRPPVDGNGTARLGTLRHRIGCLPGRRTSADPGAGRIAILRGALEDLLEDACFDAVSIWHVLEHVRNPATTLRTIARVLKPGGVLAWRSPTTPACSGSPSEGTGSTSTPAAPLSFQEAPSPEVAG